VVNSRRAGLTIWPPIPVQRGPIGHHRWTRIGSPMVNAARRNSPLDLPTRGAPGWGPDSISMAARHSEGPAALTREASRDTQVV
jgi:hypothetical protein